MENNQGHLVRNFEANDDDNLEIMNIATLVDNSEGILTSIDASLSSLNGALDRLEERTDRVLALLRSLITSNNQVRNSYRAHGGYGDPEAGA